LPVLSKPTDIGPFGHRDLAGNVHEWLSDRGGRIGGLAAGGSFTCEQAREFTTSASVSAEPDGTYSPIGFRILVEIP
jgi:formylglycine-generating enzyme required for sulfatase activity